MGPIAVPSVNLSRKFLDDQADSELALSAPGAANIILQALGEPNGPVPPGDWELGSIRATAKGAGPLRFGPAGAEAVTFTGQADGSFAAGFYADPAAALKALAPGDELEAGLRLAESGPGRYAVVQAFWDIGMSAQGAVALGGPASATFGGKGTGKGLFAVVHRFQDGETAHDVLADTFRSWALPRHIDSPDDLAPGSWLIAEVDGSLALSAGIRAGHDFSWVGTNAQGLEGEIGLRVQLAASATLGIETAGRYAVVIAREDASRTLRLRLFKLTKNGWNFALSAAAGVLGSVPDGSPEEVAAAVFGLNRSQLVENLRDARPWVSGEVSLQDKLANVLMELGRRKVGSAQADAEKLYEAGRARVGALFADFDQLGHEVTSLLLSLARVDQTALLAKMDELIAITDVEQLKARLLREVRVPGFERLPLGGLIEAAIPDQGLLSSIEDGALGLQSQFRVVKRLLDGGVLQDVLEFIAEKVSLSRIRAIATESDFQKADAWLRSRMAKFIGAAPGFEQVQKLQAAIASVLGQSDRLVKAAVEAARRQYQFAWNRKYSASTTRTALIDVSFDFGAPEALALFRSAVRGDFQRLLTEALPGVTLNAGELTHNVRRQISTELTMPFGGLTGTSLLDSTAKLTIEEDEGRVLLYSLTAVSASEQKAAFFRARSARNSTVTLTASLPQQAGVRVWKPGTFSYSYTLRRAVQKMRVSQCRAEAGPLIRKYLPEAFGAPGAHSFEEWLDDVDKTLDRADQHSGAHYIGDALTVLHVAMPSEAVRAWTKAPADPRAEIYRTLSRNLQQELKELILFYYFSDPGRYVDLASAAPVLAYASIPVTTDIRLSDGGALTLNPAGEDVYWDVHDIRKVAAMVNNASAVQRLTQLTAQSAAVLRGIPELSAQAKFYDPVPENLDRIRTAALARPAGAPLPPLLGSLLQLENALVSNAVQAGTLMGEFLQGAGSGSLRPAEALDRLARFGANVTEAFHSGFAGSNPFLGDAARPLGNLLFWVAARTFGGPQLTPPLALLELTILKSGQGLSPDQMLMGRFDQSAVLREFAIA